MKRPSKKALQELALAKVKHFFAEAGRRYNEHPGLANRYVTLARKTAMKVNLTFPRDLKRKFCKHCYQYFVPSKTCRVRIHKSKVIYYCERCKNYTRIPLKR